MPAPLASPRLRGVTRLSRLMISIRAAAGAPALDRELLAGADPAASPELSRRAGRAMSMSHRRLAAGLRRAVRDAEHPGLRPAVLIDAQAARAARWELMRLAHALEDPRFTGLRGVLAARLLLTDCASPLHCARGGRALAEAAAEALAGLRG